MLEIPKNEPAYAQIHNPSPTVTTNHNTNKFFFNPILIKDILTKIIKLAINIVKEEPLRRIVKSILIESTQTKVLRSTIQSAIPAITSTKSEYFEIFKNEEYM